MPSQVLRLHFTLSSIFNDLKLDALCFDGACLFSQGNRRLACCCDFCAAKLREATGLDMPRKVDLRTVEFRRFLERGGRRQRDSRQRPLGYG